MNNEPTNIVEYLESIRFQDLSNKRVFIGISGGINSAAVLCYLATIHPERYRPSKVFSFYAHLSEHSPDTLRFVRHMVMYGKKRFPEFNFKFSVNSIHKMFNKENFIPHPRLSPCSERLKQVPMMKYQAEMQTEINVVGYVHHERRRRERQQSRAADPLSYYYPIIDFTDEECFDLVRREIGWYPAIYDVRDEQGRRVFKHNNCLPCKNMTGNIMSDGSATGQYQDVKRYYPEFHIAAVKTLNDIETRTGLPNYWGRKPTDTTSDIGCTDFVCE